MQEAEGLGLCVACCSDLAEDERSGVKRVGLQEAFFVDLAAVTRAMRRMHIEAIVRDRFPPIGAPCAVRVHPFMFCI